MGEGRQGLEGRIAWLEEQVRGLKAQVADLNARLESAGSIKAKAERTTVAGDAADASEEILSWVGRTALLPRISTLCFLLVVALG